MYGGTLAIDAANFSLMNKRYHVENAQDLMTLYNFREWILSPNAELSDPCRVLFNIYDDNNNLYELYYSTLPPFSSLWNNIWVPPTFKSLEDYKQFMNNLKLS